MVHCASGLTRPLPKCIDQVATVTVVVAAGIIASQGAPVIVPKTRTTHPVFRAVPTMSVSGEEEGVGREAQVAAGLPTIR